MVYKFLISKEKTNLVSERHPREEPSYSILGLHDNRTNISVVRADSEGWIREREIKNGLRVRFDVLKYTRQTSKNFSAFVI